jgi:hypothetical protein
MNFRDVAVAFFPVGEEMDERASALPQPGNSRRGTAGAASVAPSPVEPTAREIAATQPAKVADVSRYASSVLWLIALGMAAAALAMIARDRTRRRERRSA